VPHGELTAQKWLDSIDKHKRRIDFCEKVAQNCRCHGNKGRPHNILYGSIESAIPENPLLGANISGVSAIQAELWVIFGQISGSQFWGLGGLNQKSNKNNVL